LDPPTKVREPKVPLSTNDEKAPATAVVQTFARADVAPIITEGTPEVPPETDEFLSQVQGHRSEPLPKGNRSGRIDMPLITVEPQMPQAVSAKLVKPPDPQATPTTAKLSLRQPEQQLTGTVARPFGAPTTTGDLPAMSGHRPGLTKPSAGKHLPVKETQHE